MSNLLMFTNVYPFGVGEQFIEKEIGIISETFKLVTIIAVEATEEDQKVREIPKNVVAFRAGRREIRDGKVIKALRLLRVLISKDPDFKGELNELTGIKKKLFLSSFEERCQDVCRRIEAEGMLANMGEENIIYSYWLYYGARIGLIMKKRNGCKFKFIISRAHRYDLYEERSPYNYLPYREYFINNINCIFPVSKNGEDYLLQNFPNAKDKVDAAYLGVQDYGVQKSNKESDFYILSCSNVIPIKRIDKIISSLKLLKRNDIRISWIHIGDGTEFKKIQNLSKELKAININVKLLGRLSNEQVIHFFRSHYIDLFLNTSYSEGLPVSIMEAMSFGVPVVATNVGGTSEIVQSGINGFLIPKDFTDYILSNKIAKVIQMKVENKIQTFRVNARETWKNKFDSQKNYADFWKKILDNANS